jgi:thioredoxin-like negative regulator of GroEL
MMELLLQAERTLAMGRLDDAERLYRKALEADPRNAIAVVGLARLAIERGDDREAYRLAGQALELDSENAAAVRLAMRLHEVLHARGESVELPPRLRAGKDGKVTGTGRRIVDRLLGRDGRSSR